MMKSQCKLYFDLPLSSPHIMHCYDVHSGVTVCMILYEDVSSCMPLGCNGCLVKHLTTDSDGFYPVAERMEEREAD